MLAVKYTSQFKRDFKAVKKRNMNMSFLNDIISKLMHEEVLDAKFKNHDLHGEYEGIKEKYLLNNHQGYHNLISNCGVFAKSKKRTAGTAGSGRKRVCCSTKQPG